jgi:hypothetical protein
MTEPNASLRGLAELVARVVQRLGQSLGQAVRDGDDAAARTQAAADVDQLRELAAAADRMRPPGTPAVLDGALLTTALAEFAEWLRAPTPASEARAQQAIAELQAVFGPLVGAATASAEDAQREQYRRDARAAIDDYFRANPIEPFKP